MARKKVTINRENKDRLFNFLYVSMKNDTSFLFAGCMNLFEHQSTYNPNMPLRLMQYIAQLYEGYIADNKLDKYGEL